MYNGSKDDTKKKEEEVAWIQLKCFNGNIFKHTLSDDVTNVPSRF